MNRLKKFFLFLAAFPVFGANAQFAPQAGLPGSTAVPATSPLIKGWATQCSVTRGWKDIRDKSAGSVGLGMDSDGTGPANSYIISLGDSGVAVLQFAIPIADGPGPDLAVFENGFINPTNPEEAFLELAFVEVSSDGQNYFRFPALSEADTTSQIPGAGVYLDCRKYHNLAGTYRGGFGTPFDLSELPNDPLLNKSRITHVRLVDVIGSVGPEGSRDAQGRKINDPFPTPFPTGGFDLDAVAVLNDANSQGVGSTAFAAAVRVSPNPATEWLHIEISGKDFQYILRSLEGKRMTSGEATEAVQIPVSGLPKGLYFVEIKTRAGDTWREKIIVQ